MALKLSSPEVLRVGDNTFIGDAHPWERGLWEEAGGSGTESREHFKETGEVDSGTQDWWAQLSEEHGHKIWLLNGETKLNEDKASVVRRTNANIIIAETLHTINPDLQFVFFNHPMQREYEETSPSLRGYEVDVGLDQHCLFAAPSVYAGSGAVLDDWIDNAKWVRNTTWEDWGKRVIPWISVGDYYWNSDVSGLRDYLRRVRLLFPYGCILFDNTDSFPGFWYPTVKLEYLSHLDYLEGLSLWVPCGDNTDNTTVLSVVGPSNGTFGTNTENQSVALNNEMRALDFDGSYTINFGDILDRGTNDFSVFWWVRLDSNSGSDYSVGRVIKRDVNSRGWTMLIRRSGGPKVEIYVGADTGDSNNRTYVIADTVLTLGVWALLGFSFDNSTGEVIPYLNGVNDLGSIGSQNADGNNLTNNGDLIVGADPLQGVSSDVRMYDHVVTEANARRIYEATKSFYPGH